MCGIALAGNKNKKKAVGKRVFDLYNAQKSRGNQGFGMISISNGKIDKLARAKWEFQIKEELLKQNSELILLHHRFPTSTENTVGTTHPMAVSHDELKYDYLVMHNGVITNDSQLKAKHEELGYKYQTEFTEDTVLRYSNGTQETVKKGTKLEFNDSECIAIELARFIEGIDDKLHTKGAAAIMGVQLKKGTGKVVSVFYGQNHGRNLGKQVKKGWTLIASEHGKEVPQMKLFFMDPKSFDVTKTVDIDMDEARKPVVSPYQASRVEDKYSSRNMGFDNENVKEEKGIASLVNARYTYDEAVETGHPMTAFYVTDTEMINGRFENMYVPKKFMGKNVLGRGLYRDTTYYLTDGGEVEQEETDATSKGKVIEILEDLAMKHARKQYEENQLDERHRGGSIAHDTYRGRIIKINNELEELEDKMSSLGLDQEEVEEVLQTACELVDFEYSNR